MAATVVNNFNEGLKCFEDYGAPGKTGAMHVIQDADQSGLTTTTNAGAPTVTTTSATLVPANAARKSLVIVNTGAVDVTIRRGAVAVAGIGIVLKAGGGTYEINSTNQFVGAINGIVASGTGTIAFEEGV